MTDGEERLAFRSISAADVIPAVTPAKVVFLDVDGVLNNWTWLGAMPSGSRMNWPGHFDPACVARLNQITARTGAKIVVSSSWRLVHEAEKLREILKAVGVEADVVAFTPEPRHMSTSRYEEIVAWLDDNSWVRPYAILDDCCYEHQDPAVVHTTMNHGLTDADVERACAILDAQ